MNLIQHRYLIIDYGSHTIKGVLYESSLLGERILAAEKLPVVKIENIPISTQDIDEQEAQKESEGKDSEFWNEYEYNLVRFVQSFFPDESSYILKVPLERLHVRDFALPTVKPKLLPQSIAFETEESLPLSLESTEVVGHAWTTDEENMHILSFGASHDLMQNSVKPLLNDQIVILSLTPDASMLACFLKLFKPEFYEGHTLGQLDIGAASTTLNIVNNGKLAFSRSLPYGGDDLSQIIADVLSIDINKAEQKKLQWEMDLLDLRPRPETFYQKHSIRKTVYEDILHKNRRWVDELCLEIERSLLALRCPSPECFYLSGGTILTKGLASLLKENLQRNVEKYPVSLSNGERAEIWTTALGAKEQHRLAATEKDNFLDTSFGSTLRGGQFNFSILKAPAAFAATALLIFALSLGLGIANDRTRAAHYQEQIYELSKGIPGILAESSPSQILIQAEDICRKRLRSRNRSSTKVLGLLQEISQRVPPPNEMELVFRKLSFDGKAVELEVELSNVGESTVLQEKLSESRAFSSIEAKRRKILPNQRARVTYRLESVEEKLGISANVNCR